MEQIKKTAWRLLCEYGANEPLNFADLCNLCTIKKWELIPYSQRNKFCQLLPQLEALAAKHNGLSFNLNGTYLIFFDDTLSNKKKTLVIAHEIGHIVFQHASSNKDLEQEANTFAYELLAPSIVLRACSINKPAEIKRLDILDKEGLIYHIVTAQDAHLDLPSPIGQELLLNFNDYITKYKRLQRKENATKYLKNTFMVTTMVLTIFIAVSTFQINQYKKLITEQEMLINSLSQPTTAATITPNSDQQLAPETNAEQLVYITPTGSRYHTENCQYVNKSATAISMEEAEKNGYQPCKVCRPQAV